MDRRLYDVFDAVRDLREELACLTDADYKFDRILQNFMVYHNGEDKDRAIENHLYHGGFEGQATEDGEILHREVKAMYQQFEEIIDEPKPIAELSLDEMSGCLLVVFE